MGVRNGCTVSTLLRRGEWMPIYRVDGHYLDFAVLESDGKLVAIVVVPNLIHEKIEGLDHQFFSILLVFFLRERVIDERHGAMAGNNFQYVATFLTHGN